MPYRKGEKGFQRKYRPQGTLQTVINARPFVTCWIEPIDPKYKSEGEWVTIRENDDFWEGYLADAPSPSLQITWLKDLYRIDPDKKYTPNNSNYFTAWLVPIDNYNKRAPVKCRIKEFETYYRGRRDGDDETNAEESWPKIAYKIIHRKED